MENKYAIELKQLEQELQSVLLKIEVVGKSDAYLDAVGRAFPLGRVGGSGKNVARLNRRRERSLDKSVDQAVALSALYAKRNALQAKISDLQNDGPAKRAVEELTLFQVRARYWLSIQAGDVVQLWTGAKVTVAKKNKKSIVTTDGCKWTASEIIGKGGADLL